MSDATKIRMIRAGFHIGNVISYLAQLYGDAQVVIRECVQNSLDKRAKHIFIDIDQIHRNINVYDDGQGAGFDEISKKFELIGQSLKLNDPEAVGEKGIGNLAGIAIAREWQLITRNTQNPADQFRFYSLNKNALKSSSNVILHSELCSSKVITNTLHFNPSARVRLLDVSEVAFRQLKSIDQLEEVLLNAFGRIISSRGVEIKISYRDSRNKRWEKTVKPVPFRGAKLDSEKYNTCFGSVKFELYCSPTPLENPRILVQHKEVYTIPLSVLFKLRQLPSEIEEIFLRGYFEGLIHLSFCTLNPARNGFELDEELTCFADTVRTFALEVLKPIVDNFEEEGRLDKYRRVAESVLKRLAELLKVEPDIIPPGLKSFTETAKRAAAKPQTPEVKVPLPKQRVVPKTLLKDQRRKAEKEAGSAKPPEEKKKSKTVVPQPGIGLQFILPGVEEEFGWHSRLSPEGIIQINAGNTDFRKAEMLGVSKLDDYVLTLVLKEFTCASTGPVEARIFNDEFERVFMKFWRVKLAK